MSLAWANRRALTPSRFLVQQPPVASRPRLRDPVSAQLRHQRLRPGVLQLAERPVKQVDVGVDDVRRGIGTAVRLLARGGAPRQRPKALATWNTILLPSPKHCPVTGVPPGKSYPISMGCVPFLRLSDTVSSY